MDLRTQSRVSVGVLQILIAKQLWGVLFLFIFLIHYSESLVQTPIVTITCFCNLFSCSLAPFLPSRDVLQREFPTVSTESFLAQVLPLSPLSLHLTRKQFPFTFKALQNLSPAIFSWVFFPKRPFPISDLASFCSHSFNFSYHFLPSCPLCLKETFYKCLQGGFIVSYHVPL